MKKRIKTFIAFLSVIAIFVSMSWSESLSVEAASYPSIMLNDVPYFPQKIEDDCGISSIAMIEAYALGYDSSCFDAVYDGVYATNGSLSIGPAVNSGKYTDITKDLATVYKQLKAGKPVLIYRGSPSKHWSVIVGYNGSSTTLEKSGFIVYNTARGVAVGKPYTSNLSDWLSGTPWSHAKVRNTGAINGITTSVSTLTLQNVQYPSNLKTGSGMGTRGLLISKGKIAKVTAGVKNSSGTVIFDGDAKPKSKYFTLLNLDTDMKFRTLSAGTYTYYVTASDSTGATLNWEKQFKVSSSATSLKTTTFTGSGGGSTQSSIYSDVYVESVTETDAVMNASFDTVRYVTTAGVYFGTDQNNLKKITENTNCNAKKIYYSASKWIGTLHPGTKYYYQLYATIDGVEHKTDIYSFTTLDQSNPVINSAEIVSITGSGYTVRCKASDNGHILRVCFPSWTTANGQDDLVDNWKDNTAVYSPDSNGYYTYKVNISDHNNESGEYNTYIYVYDSVGNRAKKTLACEVYPLKSISLSKSAIALDEGASTTLSVTYNPTNTTEVKMVSWKSSNTSVAKVSSVGKVTAVSAGQATITVTVAGKTASCTVTVKDGSEAQVKAFVERMYTVALGRSADASGVEYWTNLLLTGQQDGASLAQSFIFGDEFVKKNYTSQQYIDVLYKTFFNREADSSGSAYWLQLMNNRTSRKAVLAGFVNSQEFSELCSSYGISRGTLMVEDTTVPDGIYSFVERLYTCALERQGDSDGIGYWAQNIAAKGSTPEDVAKLFFLSNEYVAKNVSDDKYIETLYITFMNRVCDASGKAYWINALNSGMTREGALIGFAQSTEFKAIMQSYGL